MSNLIIAMALQNNFTQNQGGLGQQYAASEQKNPPAALSQD